MTRANSQPLPRGNQNNHPTENCVSFLGLIQSPAGLKKNRSFSEAASSEARPSNESLSQNNDRSKRTGSLKPVCSESGPPIASSGCQFSSRLATRGSNGLTDLRPFFWLGVPKHFLALVSSESDLRARAKPDVSRPSSHWQVPGGTLSHYGHNSHRDSNHRPPGLKS